MAYKQGQARLHPRLHYHYTYSFRSNKMTRGHIHCNTCDLQEQTKLRKRQTTIQYWKDHPGREYVAYASKEYCVLIETLKSNETKISSKAKIGDFVVLPYADLAEFSLNTDLDTDIRNVISRYELLRIFDNRCIRYPLVNDVFQTLREEIKTMASFDEVQKYLIDAEHRMNNYTKTIDKEPQYNSWVFSDIQSTLIRSRFGVEAEYPNKDIIPAVNEYSTSYTDCVIFHGNTTSTTLNLLNLHVEDDSNVEIEEPDLELTNAPQLTHHVFANAYEVKTHSIDNSAIAECFGNMFGVGTRFATDVLLRGKMVETINVYGLVVSMLNPSTARLLMITVNMHRGETTCRLIRQSVDLAQVFNLVLKKLRNEL